MIAGSLLLALGCGGLGYARVGSDISLMDYYPSDHPNHRLQTLVEEVLGGVLIMDVVVDLPEEGGHLDPDVLQRLQQLQQRVLELPGVTAAHSAVDYLRLLHSAASGTPADSPLPGDRSLIAQEWLLAEMAGQPLPLERYIAGSGRTLRIELRLLDVGGRATLALSDQIEKIGAELFAGVPGATVHTTGDAEMVSRNTATVISDLFVSLCLAGAFIFLCLLAIFRSLRLAAVSVLPNAFPLIATVGFMGAFGIDLDVSTVVIFSIALGLAVDDTIHVIVRFREELRHDGDAEAAIRRSLAGTGSAVILTSLVLGAGMLLLLTSQFVPTRQFGLLTFLTLLTALLADLLLLPALLLLAYRGRSKS